jgi:hypothetical protein
MKILVVSEGLIDKTVKFLVTDCLPPSLAWVMQGILYGI